MTKNPSAERLTKMYICEWNSVPNLSISGAKTKGMEILSLGKTGKVELGGK